MPTYNKSADSAILFTPLAASVKTMRRVAVNTMSVAVDASEVLAPIVTAAAENTITIATSAPVFRKSASNAFSIAGVASSIKTKNPVAVNALAVSMSASAILAKNVSASNSISVESTSERAASVLNKLLNTGLQIYGGANLDLEQGKVGFYYPYGGPTMQVILKKPLFGDNREQYDQVTVRHSRSGERYAYAKSPTYTRLNFTFTEVSQTLAEDFLELCLAAKAQDVKFIDWYQRTWRGVIVNEPRVIQTIARGTCSEVFTLTVQFEGELV